MAITFLCFFLVGEPSITTQPIDQLLVTFGTDVTFSVEATGDALMYHWQKDGVDINDAVDTYMGTDTTMLTVLNVTDPDDEGVYQVVVANAVGIVTSDEGRLTIREYSNCTQHVCYNRLIFGSCIT